MNWRYRAAPGRTDGTGFTLVELITALALMAVLVSIAWGRFHAAYKHALEATMQSDLRNLTTAQELYYEFYFTYASDPDQVDIHPSAESNLSISEATPSGWAGYSQIARTDKRCEIYVGDASPSQGLATESEQVFCGVP